MATLIEMPFAVEGSSDVGFAQQIIRHCGAMPGTPYGQKGKPDVLKKLPGYFNAANYRPWLALVDWDGDYECAPTAATNWTPTTPSRYMSLRIVQHSIEAWAMGDSDRCSNFFGIQKSSIPRDPEVISNPKQQFLTLLGKSRKRSIREGMCVRPGSGRLVGPRYVSLLREFSTSHWRVDEASERCPSLSRTVIRLKEKIELFSDTDTAE